MKWNTNMDEAPRDGTPFIARIPGHGEDNIIAWDEAYLDGANRPCGAWTYVEDREPPEDWTDGVCWDVNEDGKPSTQPTAWMPLPRMERRASDG